MNPFAQMTQALTSAPRKWQPRQYGIDNAALTGLDKTNTLRALLRLYGPALSLIHI